MIKAERRYYINQSFFGIKERKPTMDCNNDENDISSADESEVSQSKVSSDISQGIKNISDEMTHGQNINDESSFCTPLLTKDVEIMMIQIISLQKIKI